MKISTLRRYSFSSYYDLITIGPFANRIAKAVSKYSNQTVSILTVEQENKIVEPSLIPSGVSIIDVNQSNHRFSDIEMGVGVQ